MGCAGAGKSTLARRLGAALDLPVVHLDRHFWRPGWVEPPREEWRAEQELLLAGDGWVADGNYGNTLDIRLRRADTMVLIDLPRRTCLRRVLWRSLRDHGRDTQAPGCPERFDLAFIRYVWRFRRVSLPRVLDGLAAHPHVVVLRSRRDVERFLATAAAAGTR